MAPPRSINIGPYSFPVTAAYSDGVRPVGPAEHEVLDGARAERVRKKAHREFEKMRLRSGRRTLSEGELRHLAATVAALDASMDLTRLANPQDATALSRPGHTFAGLGGDPDEASEFDTDVSGQFFASAPGKLTGPIEAMRQPHLHDRTNQEAAWQAVTEVSGIDFSQRNSLKAVS